MSLPRYPEYKDSGVEWLGDVPSHWEVKRVKRLVTSIEQGWSPQCESFPVEEETEWGVLKVGCVNGGVFRPHENKKLPPELNGLPELGIREGDLLISRANTRELVGSAAVAEQDYLNLLLCDKLYRLRLSSHMCNPRFLARYLGFKNARVQIELAASGASSSMLNIGQLVILELFLGVPSIDEQSIILTFLDRETAKIDALIDEQEKLLTLLAEKRQATISHAVTKGLNPDVQMKDSGVEWLGEVPAHWDVKRLKQIVELGASVSYGIVQPGAPLDEGIPFIQTTNMSNGSFKLEQLQKTTAEIANAYPRSRLAGGEVILGIRASIGAAYVAPKHLAGANLSRGVARIVCGQSVSSEYLVHVLRSNPTFHYWALCKQGSTFNEVSIETVRELAFSLPPTEEQAAIVTFLDAETARVDSLTTEATRAISLLKERRTTLISAAVTGKIDVRSVRPEKETCHA